MSQFTSFSLTPKSTSKAAVVHSVTAEGNMLCSNKVADISKGALSNMEVTCKRCLGKLNPKPKAEKVAKPKAEKSKKVSQKAEVSKLAAEKTDLALQVVMASKDQRKQPEFVAKRQRLVELRDQLQLLGYEATTYQANAKMLAGMTFVTKRTRKSKKA